MDLLCSEETKFVREKWDDGFFVSAYNLKLKASLTVNISNGSTSLIFRSSEPDFFNLEKAKLTDEISRKLFEKIMAEASGNLGVTFLETPTYEQVLELKREYEAEMYRKPKLVDSGVFYHKTSGVQLKVETILYDCGVKYSAEKFKEYLFKKSIPVKHILEMNKYLDRHYEIITGKLEL